MDALIMLLLFFLACGCAIYCALCLREQRRCALGTGDWARFYKRVAPVLNGVVFGELPRPTPVWLTVDGKIHSNGMEFVVDDFCIHDGGTYEINGSAYNGGDINSSASYKYIKLNGKLK